MLITDIIKENTIQVELEAEDKQDLLEKMLELASNSGLIIDKDEALKEINKREKIMSTGVGKSIALPHAKTNSVSSSVGAFAILKEPLDFDSLDGEPVKLVFLLLGRQTDVSVHLKLLSKISRLLNNDSYRTQLLRSTKIEEVIDIFEQSKEL